MDTIFAVSSGSPPAAIAVLRISGPRALDAARAMMTAVPEPRRPVLRKLRHPLTGDLLDHALILRFDAPATATGEDLIELHLHGGRAVVAAVEAGLAAIPGLRPAEAGEFTRRALSNGRIDLTEAEGLGDLLAAETESQRRAAVMATEGLVGRMVERWTARTVELSARLEALIDHSDEDDVGDEADALAIREDIAALLEEIETILSEPPVERIRDGIRVVLAGPPNSGKSTLLNRLAERDAAIVSPVAGTTRDRIEVPVVKEGVAYLLTDTAGLRDAVTDVVEAIGIERAQQALEGADIVLWLGAGPLDDEGPAQVIALHAKCDIAASPSDLNRLSVSGVSGEGIGELWKRIGLAASARLPSLALPAINQRQRALTEEAAAHLALALRESDFLLLAESVRQARVAFDRITGKGDVEAMMDALFGLFCIGK